MQPRARHVVTYNYAENQCPPPCPKVCVRHPYKEFLVQGEQRELDKPQTSPILHPTGPHDLRRESDVFLHAGPGSTRALLQLLNLEERGCDDDVEYGKGEVGGERDVKPDILHLDNFAARDLDDDSCNKDCRRQRDHGVVCPQEVIL